MKHKLVISFSSGESSAFMAQWLLNNKKQEYDMIFIFANTGDENEESLIFADKCDKYFGLNLIWVEAIVNPNFGHGIRAKVVNFETASREAEPFEAVIAKLGIPNMHSGHCTRELKERTINAYLKSIEWKGYYRAIGIRMDELDRVNEDWKKQKIIYPLISSQFIPMTKPMINEYWNKMPFRVNLKGYEDNCKVCWKKSLRKLLTIAKHNPERFEKFAEFERKYENYIPETRKHNENIKLPLRFYRDNLSVVDILRLSKNTFEEAIDERQVYAQYKQFDLFNISLDIGGGPCGSESCEAFAK